MVGRPRARDLHVAHTSGGEQRQHVALVVVPGRCALAAELGRNECDTCGQRGIGCAAHSKDGNECCAVGTHAVGDDDRCITRKQGIDTGYVNAKCRDTRGEVARIHILLLPETGVARVSARVGCVGEEAVVVGTHRACALRVVETRRRPRTNGSTVVSGRGLRRCHAR